MNNSKEENIIKGKTFSLYGSESVSDNYFVIIKKAADFLIANYFGSGEALLGYLRLIDNRNFLKRLSKRGNSSEEGYEILRYLKDNLSAYTLSVHTHLENLSLREKFNKVISTTEEQYHLYMVEIELVNRIYSGRFHECEYKIALLPHCIHDLKRRCMSKPDEIDYKCKSCSKNCYINNVCRILSENNIDGYIWLTADLKKLITNLRKKYATIGIMGIACIPELINGMKRCIKYGLPVIGVPLDANRCRRWMGEFYPNTVNLNKVREIVVS